MRKLYFLLPGTTPKFNCGGLFAELKTLELAQQVCPAEVVTYRQRQRDTLFLDDLLGRPLGNGLFVVSWGFDVPKLVRRLKDYPVMYHAHSSEYGFRLPSRIPIVTVSRNTLGYWGQRAPGSLLYYLPNQISDEFCDRGQPRDIDVLIIKRKSSSYLLQSLLPELQRRLNVVFVDSFVEDLAHLYNRSKVYLYDSAEYWAIQGVTEGFGLQPLEAMACGCQVFSSLNHGLSDYLDPGFNCHKIGGRSRDYDVTRITHAVKNFTPTQLPPSMLEEYRRDSIIQRLEVILAEINQQFDHPLHEGEIPMLTPTRVLKLRSQWLWEKAKQKARRKAK
jgi:glycosyltransferase involved in cell wall biosynthesis